MKFLISLWQKIIQMLNQSQQCVKITVEPEELSRTRKVRSLVNISDHYKSPPKSITRKSKQKPRR